MSQPEKLPPTRPLQLEICIDRFCSARAALSGGAHRLEVCGALELGGITPSYGLVEQCVDLSGPDTMMMIRPHGGGFCYSSDDIETMARDIRLAKQLRVRGVVFGALTQDGRIDHELCRRLMDIARPLSVTFHRAFDVVGDPWKALDCLLDLGVDRLLTSGQAASALEGVLLIRRLVQRAGPNLSVMAGAGVAAGHLATLVQSTGVREIHASASDGVGTSVLTGGNFARTGRLTSEEKVRALVEAMRQEK